MTISPSGPNIKNSGSNFSLVCSANIYSLTVYGSPSILEWFFGPENSSLPSGVVVSNVTNSGNNYTSTLQFSPLLEAHTGIYTCQIGHLATSTIIFAGSKLKGVGIKQLLFTVIFCSLYSPHQQCWYSGSRWKLQSDVHCDWNNE